MPPPGQAKEIAALDHDLDRVAAQQTVDSTRTVAAAKALVVRADALGWQPSVARAHIALGKALSASFQDGALDELTRGAQLAVASHMDRDAVEASITAIDEAWYRHKPDVLEMVLTQARTTAAHADSPGLSLKLEITYGRALIQMEKWDEGLGFAGPRSRPRTSSVSSTTATSRATACSKACCPRAGSTSCAR